MAFQSVGNGGRRRDWSRRLDASVGAVKGQGWARVETDAHGWIVFRRKPIRATPSNPRGFVLPYTQ
ncbi:MAG: hypothetical protein NZ699_04375 [Roseiflexus sp.]|nr:hypothetical protein [Roseiflexus sp.]MCS7288349.1 hypothetical protein [Roseiflexus sp.]MDW8146499.1 hypothetical protein [Roseiflexaceae bacterium]MDW8231222.1 hypothetical protein [Roseiflexaceae bacterium]